MDEYIEYFFQEKYSHRSLICMLQYSKPTKTMADWCYNIIFIKDNMWQLQFIRIRYLEWYFLHLLVRISKANTCRHAPFSVLYIPPPSPPPWLTSASPPQERKGCSAGWRHQLSSVCYSHRSVAQLVSHRWCNHYRLLPCQALVCDADCSQPLPPQNYCQNPILSLLFHRTGCWITLVKLLEHCSSWKLISMKTLVARTPSWIWFACSVLVSESYYQSDCFWVKKKGCHYAEHLPEPLKPLPESYWKCYLPFCFPEFWR